MGFFSPDLPFKPSGFLFSPPFIRHQRVGRIPAGCRISLRCRHYETVRPRQCHRSDCQGTSASHGRLQDDVRQNNCHRLECAQLLLPVRRLLLVTSVASSQLFFHDHNIVSASLLSRRAGGVDAKRSCLDAEMLLQSLSSTNGWAKNIKCLPTHRRSVPVTPPVSGMLQRFTEPRADSSRTLAQDVRSVPTKRPPADYFL